jgi:ferredoxin-nitrite reductase
MSAPNEFSKEQQAYLQGLMLGVDVARKVKNLPVLSGSASQGTTFQIGGNASPATWLPKIHADAQDRFVAAGKTLVAEEKAKREKNGLEIEQPKTSSPKGPTFSLPSTMGCSLSHRHKIPSCAV